MIIAIKYENVQKQNKNLEHDDDDDDENGFINFFLE